MAAQPQTIPWPFRGNRGHFKTKINSDVTERVIIPGYFSTETNSLILVDPYTLIIANISASSCNVTIREGMGGEIRYVFAVPAGDTRGFAMPKESADQSITPGNAWTATCSGSVDSIEISALFVKNS